VLDRPRVDQPHYGAHLGDADYWEPYVTEVLLRNRLPKARLDAPFVGTFPTFLVGNFVVKLFGETFEGAARYKVELALHELLADHPEIPAPGLVATGDLFEDEHRWPYLITQRISGVAVREADLGKTEAAEIASRLGEITARLHQLSPPPVVDDPLRMLQLRGNATERLRGFGLPEHLVEQVPDYLEDAPDPGVLVHADITADHVLVDAGQLVGVIDWGDALLADPYYELVAVYLDALRGQSALLERFLDGYSWKPSDDFPRRALQGVLEFEFNAIDNVRRLNDLDSIDSLDVLADRLFALE
jgi:hygromycin-B 7''-O-kinase